MITMSNPYEMYHRQQQQQQQMQQQQQQQQQQQHHQRRSASPTLFISSDSMPIGGTSGTSGGNNSGGESPLGAGKETIHSGQFMVSHFEAEEAQDDDDSEIKMLDPEDPTLSKPDEPSECTQLQLYVPIKVKEYGSMSMIASHLEIETSLTKLFKCMNLAYSQKLTSPKWNHFKGVRLRWKDKIRLNNVIWRCWHMQFILKRKTPVCQFASPLDADIHSNPQSVVLEGKYWKRQLTVIKAEYRKWRRNFKSNNSGCLIYDTKSELDLFEWSPMLTEDWTTDTLFSAINVPFPFPDPREIARGAGNADFIQPSLGPLQPNLDDLDLTFEELLQNTRLPSVPEEGNDDMLKAVDYGGFSAIMGTDQMDSSDIMDVTNQTQSMSNGEDSTMMELNTPLNALQYSELEREFQNNLGSQPDLSTTIMMNTNNNNNDNSNNINQQQQQQNSIDSDFSSSPKRQSIKTFPITMDSSGMQMQGFSTKSVIKGRVSKNSQRPFRREPHNYDKAQPTLHQTEIYQQMLAESQQQQHHLQQSLNLQIQAQHPTTNQPQQQQLSQQQQFPTVMMTNTGNNNFNLNQTQNLLNLPQNSNIKPYPVAQKSVLVPNVKIEPPPAPANTNTLISMYTNLNTTNPTSDLGVYHRMPQNRSQVVGQQQASISLPLPSLRPYPNLQNFPKSASTGNYINVRNAMVGGNGGASQDYVQLQQQQQRQVQHQQQQQQPQHIQQHHIHSQSLPTTLRQHQLILPLNTSSTSSQQQQQQQQQQPQSQQTHQQQQQQQDQPILPKEMFRSNSLPLNSSLQKLESRNIEHFVVPKYQAKSHKSRSRSNSIHHQSSSSTLIGGAGGGAGVVSSGSNLQVPRLQTATSDPMLNSTLAQLLTAPSHQPKAPLPSSASSAAASGSSLSSSSSYVPSTRSDNRVSSQQQHQSMSKQTTSSPKKSTSLPVPAPPLMIHSPPPNKMLSFPPPSGHMSTSTMSLSPESFHDQDSPLSPTHTLKYPRETQRRAGHIHAEQKRRYNIKNGFDMLHSLIPQLQQNPNAKLSKAAMLQKGADYIKQLRSERSILKEKMELLRKERDNLNSSLSHLHSILPANGAPVTRQRTERVRQLYEHYVKCRTMQNWKFWILGLILEPLIASYTTSVSSASADELQRTVFLWVDQHCSLVDLRPAVSNKLRYLSTTTDILSDPPSTLQEEVSKAINNTPGQHPNLTGS